jgi:hypothetical protein
MTVDPKAAAPSQFGAHVLERVTASYEREGFTAARATLEAIEWAKRMSLMKERRARQRETEPRREGRQ